jgi:molybdate transport system substrate-binding protein
MRLPSTFWGTTFQQGGATASMRVGGLERTAGQTYFSQVTDMFKTILAMVGSLAVVAGLCWSLGSTDSGARTADRTTGVASVGDAQAGLVLHVYCAASNKAVLEPICDSYESLTGTRIEVEYGPSQTLLARLELTGTGDLFLPADDSFLKDAREKGFVREELKIAKMQVGLAVRKGNPKNLNSLSQLISGEVRLVQANPEVAAVGKITKKTLSDAGSWQALSDATIAFRGSVTEVAADVEVGAADAGIVYDVVLYPYENLEFVPLDALKEVTSQVSIGVLSTSAFPDESLHFARFVTSRDQGLRIYAEHGFQIVNGARRADTPELSNCTGLMLDAAIENTNFEFDKREDNNVTGMNNGDGIIDYQSEAAGPADKVDAIRIQGIPRSTAVQPLAVAKESRDPQLAVRLFHPICSVESREVFGAEGLHWQMAPRDSEN